MQPLSWLWKALVELWDWIFRLNILVGSCACVMSLGHVDGDLKVASFYTLHVYAIVEKSRLPVEHR
jgi:hypothetical protein